MTITERFWSKVDTSAGLFGCWPWMAARMQGYGAFWLGRQRRAHRVAYELRVGPIPPGLQLDHLCRNRACVNPAHLEAVTRRENILRGVSPSARQARQTHCIRGHPFDEANTSLRGRKRGCLACKRSRYHAKRDRLRTVAIEAWRR